MNLPNVSSFKFYNCVVERFVRPVGVYFNIFSKVVNRDLRIVDAELVPGKLKKQWESTQKQKNEEKDGSFKYLGYKSGKIQNVHSEKLSVGEYSVGVCHAQGRRPTMEDEHLATSFNLSIQGKTYPIQLFGVFDGHGGAEASKYVKNSLEKKLKETLLEFNSKGLTEEGVWNALKMTFVQLSEEFKKTGKLDGTTATVSLLLDGKLWTANVGDSRTILENKDGETLQLSEDAKPDSAPYKKSIEKRGGFVANIYGVPRINGNLAVGRAIGDLSVGKGMTARPKITMIPLSKIKPGSHLVLACDGIYDVASTRQVGKAVKESSKTSAVSLAENLVYSAYQAGSGDNLSALVIKFPSKEEPKSNVPFQWFFNWLSPSSTS